jgi:hypothetical protein
MAETLIQERYQLDFDASQATENIVLLAIEADRLRANLEKAKAGTAQFEKAVVDLARVEEQLVNVLGQEVRTYDGIIAKRKIMQLALTSLTRGSEAYKRVSQEIQVLQKAELNTLDGLNARREILRKGLNQLQIGSREYIATLKELNALEKKSASATADLSKSSGSFTSALRGGLASIGLVVGIQEAIQFGKESFQAFADKQQQKNALLTALNNQEAVQERLLAQADLLEQKTLVDDDDIIALDRYLASLGLTEKQITKINEASVQLAAVQGTSVRSAADKLIAAQSGQIRGLVKLVPEVRNLTKAQLAAGDAADLVAKKFKGSAEALATGIAGAQNELKDFAENFKEGVGEGIAGGIGKLASTVKVTFGGIFGEFTSEATSFIGEFLRSIFDLPANLVATVNGVVQVIKALFQGTLDNFQRVSLGIQEGYLDLKEAIFGGLDTEDLLKSSRIAGEKVKLAIESPFANGVGLIDIFAKGFRDAFAEADKFTKAYSANLNEADNKPFLPNVPKKVATVKGSLADLEEQLGKLKEAVSKSVVATDVKALEPLLLKIEELEKRIAAAKKLQESLIPKQIDIEFLPTKNVQGDFLAKALEAAKVEQQAILQNSAERLAALEREQTAELTAAGVTAEQKKEIDARYQQERERLAIETERRIATNALQQKSLELAELQRNSKPGQNLEGIAKLKAEIAQLQTQLAQLQNKSVQIEVDFAPNAKEKLKTDIKAIADSVVQLADAIGQAIGSIFDRQEKRASDLVEKQKSRLQDALANSENFTAEQIALERERLDKLQKEQEAAQKKARALALAQVIINTVVAVAKAASQTGVAAPIAIITTLAAIAGGIAAATALANGSFYEGTDYVQRGSNPQGRDTVPAMVNEGEAIISTDTNKKYNKTIRAIRREQIPPEVLNDYVDFWRRGEGFTVPTSQRTGIPKAVSHEVVSAHSNGNYYFQAKLGKLEQEAEIQSTILERIEKNVRPQAGRVQVARRKTANRPERFV